MPDWDAFRRAVGEERTARWLDARDREADRRAGTTDMTAVGYLREWASRCFPNDRPMLAWEHAYAEAGLIDAAADAGWVLIADDARGNVSLTDAGRELLGLSRAAGDRRASGPG
jgi:hypothetical protein